MVEWERRHAIIQDYETQEVIFEQKDVEVPSFWSENAVKVLAQKYFRGQPGTPERETSLKDIVDRVVDRIVAQAVKSQYMSARTAKILSDELKYILITQRAAFNSPVWFNIGAPNVRQQASACFILGVEDSIESISKWYSEEAQIFKYGSGAGVNLSEIRGSSEPVNGGGRASGPVTFMRGADAIAGTIKSGGRTRRAAKMVILDIDHPDVEDFIECKVREEKKAFDLAAAGWDMAFTGRDSFSVQYQNANNTVRLSDEFMQAVEDDTDWDLIARGSGEVTQTMPARELFRKVSTAAWESADPGVHFSTTINKWHTLIEDGEIVASNPCSEYLSITNSSCNLASLRLTQFLEDGEFLIRDIEHVTRIMFIAQDLLIEFAEFPTDLIGSNTRKFRQIGLGYAALGSTLTTLGLPYDSDEGRAVAAALTALICGVSYSASADIAEVVGPYAGFKKNKKHQVNVLQMHTDAIEEIDVSNPAVKDIVSRSRTAWNSALKRSKTVGVRNSQATVLAPTGTIGILMDAGTLGIEPAFALATSKRLSGGGTMMAFSDATRAGLEALEYPEDQIQAIEQHVLETGDMPGAPHITDEHLPVFATAVSQENSIEPMGHIKMMAVTQPFLSGAISKTCNLPSTASVQDIEDVYLEGWKLGLKAIAVYRDGSKHAQPLSAAGTEDEDHTTDIEAVPMAVRRRIPNQRDARNFTVKIASAKVYMTVGLYPNGEIGEVFLQLGGDGSTIGSVLDSLARSISQGIQFGVPLEEIVSSLIGMKADPAGITNDPDFRIVSSIQDWIGRRLAYDFLEPAARQRLNVYAVSERASIEEVPPTQQGMITVKSEEVTSIVEPESSDDFTGHVCPLCSGNLVPSGACMLCVNCGETTGCS